MADDKISRRAEIAGMLRAAAQRHIRSPGRVFIFGSQANRATMKRADIDIGVDVGRKLDSAEYFALFDDFAALPMLYPVDLVDFAAVSDDFRHLAESNIELLT
jgi:predicted nucleotidyltransferase